MRKNLTEIVFILDRSGSMSGLEADTIGGFNSMIEKQKKAEGEALISTVLFDNTSEVIHDRVSVQNIKPMTDDDYTVRGCTALLDAIGGAIHHIGNVHKYARAEDVPEHKSAFRAKHEAELVIFEAAKTTLLAMQSDQKLPSLKALQAEQQRLTDEQQRLYDERTRLKREMKQIDTIKTNVDMLLRIGDEQEQIQQRFSQRE